MLFSIFMQKYRKLPQRPMRLCEETLQLSNRNPHTKGHQGQLLQGVLEDIETNPRKRLVSSSTITSSFTESIADSEDLHYEVERQVERHIERQVQSATNIAQPTSHQHGLVRFNTTIGTVTQVKKYNDLKNAKKVERPKLPTTLFWTRGDGSSITGLE